MIAQQLSVPTLVATLYHKKPLPLVKDLFERWLVGFIDAEGNFQVFMDRNYTRVKFRICLHIDDVAILHYIVNMLKVGKVYTNGNTATLVISNLQDLSNVLLPILHKHKLLTTKYLDFLDFCKVVDMLIDNGSSAFYGSQLEWIRRCIKNMNSGRTTFDLSLIPNTPVNLFWLMGFIEGEGTFGMKNLIPYFQLGQHSRNTFVLEKIREYLATLASEFGFSGLNISIKTVNTLNKRTSVLVISISNIDALHDILAYHLLSYTFITRKSVDFYYWCLALYMFKYGYAYLPEGRKLLVAIANYINKSRYSTSGKNPPVPVIDMTLFDTPLPVTLTPDMTHAQLAHAFAILTKRDKNRTIWVYDNGLLVEGSPFSTNAAAAVGAGQKRQSKCVERFLNTGKLFLNRYEFTTTAKLFN